MSRKKRQGKKPCGCIWLIEAKTEDYYAYAYPLCTFMYPFLLTSHSSCKQTSLSFEQCSSFLVFRGEVDIK